MRVWTEGKETEVDRWKWMEGKDAELDSQGEELLVDRSDYRFDPIVNLWFIGCVFTEILLGHVFISEASWKYVLCKIFKFYGTPNNRSWPGMEKIPHYQFMKILPFYKRCERSMFIEVKNCPSMDLTVRLLILNPKKRIIIAKVHHSVILLKISLAKEHFSPIPRNWLGCCWFRFWSCLIHCQKDVNTSKTLRITQSDQNIY